MPFDADRADLRQAFHTWWMRQTWCENHTGKVTDYRLNLAGEEEKNEATILMDEVAELFSLR